MGYSNGRFPDSALAPIAGGRLAKPYALRWNIMNMLVRRAGQPTVMPNGSMSSYRTYAQQVYLKQLWAARGQPGNAANPGTSNHGIGAAVDSNARNRAWAYGRPVGVHPPTDAPWEAWHTLVHADPIPNALIAEYTQGTTDPTIRRGSLDRAAITRLQKLLRGLNLTRVVNGKYGIWTRRAVRRFQAKHHLPVDGVVGPKTWLALRAASHH